MNVRYNMIIFLITNNFNLRKTLIQDPYHLIATKDNYLLYMLLKICLKVKFDILFHSSK